MNIKSFIFENGFIPLLKKKRFILCRISHIFIIIRIYLLNVEFLKLHIREYSHLKKNDSCKYISTSFDGVTIFKENRNTIAILKYTFVFLCVYNRQKCSH